jgi:hypothetical protein
MIEGHGAQNLKFGFAFKLQTSKPQVLDAMAFDYY